MRVNVAWFKCTDLRTHDHAALKAAHAGGLPVLHLYVFDPFWHANTTRRCGFPKTGPIRTRFQLEALADLASRLEAEGHVLNTRSQVSTAACFEELCEDYEVNAVFAFREICSEELRVERQVREVLRRRGQGQLQLFWGFELYHRDDLRFDPASARAPFNSYTAFRKRVEENSRLRPSSAETPSFRKSSGASVNWPRGDRVLPSVREAMGRTYDEQLDPGEEKDPRAELRWRGGETAALERVRQYLWEEDSLGLDYVGATMTTDPGKSCMRDKAMSKLSPWLAHGCLSPRFLYEEVQRYERERKKTKSTYWITHELLWRDFVRFGSIQAGTSIFKIGGLKDQHPVWRWSDDRRLLGAWREGRTGFPFLDCFMRELKTTGYCNHMGRECSGWFLIGDLGIDWRMGAEWFESILVDYEPTANWYNWAYRCLPAAARGSQGGAGPGERLQGLEILRWGTQHDPDATYIKRWLPELSSLPATVAREPWRLGLLERNGPSDGGLRELPAGRFSVDGKALAELLSMGFEQSDAAMALYRTWGDSDAAVALLVSDKEAITQQDASEEDDLERAIQLSLQEASTPASTPASGDPAKRRSSSREGERPGAPNAGFRYGEDYPKPIIQPVSLMRTEEAEDEARREQARRDQQNAAVRQRQARSQGFDKARWEEAKQHRQAETPTSASWRRGRQADHNTQAWQSAYPAKGEGKRGRGGRESGWSEAAAGGEEGWSQGRPASSHGASGQQAAEPGTHKRRWREGRGRIPDEPARGG